MIGFLVRKIFGSKNDRFLKKLRPLVAKINALEPEMQALADEELPQRLAVYREQVQNGEKDLDAVLPEVFALVREASTRVLGMRHYDVQLLGAMALHNGKIAEMKTGEGKTLVATLAVILNSLEGKGVHVVTVNDYLAKRDAEWMGRLYNFLGLSVGVIVAGLSDEQRKEAYGADITYGTNNEFGFDYLRDNMKFYAEQLVQRGHHYAIVDEVKASLGSAGMVFVAICMLFFAFSTIIGWYFFGEQNVKALFGHKAVKVYAAIVVICIVIGSALHVDLVWNLSDLFNGLMVFPNLIALLALSGLVAKAAHDKDIMK